MAPRKPTYAEITYEIDHEVERAIAPFAPPEAPTWGPDAKLSVVGKPIPRVDGYLRTTGRAKYTYDLNFPGMVYGAVLMSPYPRAKGVRVNAAAAKKVPGVLDVMTGADAENGNKFGTRGARLLTDAPNFAGEYLAALVAETPEAAREGMRALQETLEADEILPHVVDIEDAAKPDAPKLDESGNERKGDPEGRGDVEKGFAEAEATVDLDLRTPVETHACLETHGSVASWEGDALTVYDSTQAVFGVRGGLAATLGIPENKVRVIQHFMGGGFGSKLGLDRYTVLAALFAKRLGRPAKFFLTRRQDLVNSGHRPSSIQRLRAGAKKDGTLTALELVSTGPAGSGCGRPIQSLYACPNVRVVHTEVRINAGPPRPQRAPGDVQGATGLEVLLDRLAEKLGVDPLDLRLKNFAETDPGSGRPYSSNALKECYAKGAEAFGWKSLRAKKPGSDPGPLKRGVGMGAQIWPGGGAPNWKADCALNPDGTAEVRIGTQDIGTGTKTILCQVAAEELGLPIERVSITIGDTNAPFGGSSGGSVVTPSSTPAVHEAAHDAKERLLALAAPILGKEAGDLEASEGRVRAKGETAGGMTFAEVIRKANAGSVVGSGTRTLHEKFKDFSILAFGAQFAEVEVDVETGVVRVLRVVAAHDCGRPVNPMLAASQVEGGVIQGICFALYSERIMDRKLGDFVNANLHDYRLALMPDVPEIATIFCGSPDPIVSSVGAKGIGEPAVIPTAGAIVNAVHHATGVWCTELPLTPDRVLRALGIA
ncbi:MAG TPA: xanthine dehydrogenase family protein molybdopterin-binding subunit [Planctomycetota bacterium]|jgi:xanthine dehydrogenase YagR molybdenum-binding subunit|nr:xanthine dehydrogenase family protein molybdopterin-binding subunit [Planctomycetota bacterium]